MTPVLHSFAYALEYLREQVADVRAADMAALPTGVANHPAWVIGHLTFTSQMLAGAVAEVPPWLPAGWDERYGTGSVPVADVSAYEPKDVALGRLGDAEARIVHAVEGASEARLDDAFPDDSLRELFPTIRAAVTQVLAGHAAFHVGQVSVWRRAMGLPHLKRGFE